MGNNVPAGVRLGLLVAALAAAAPLGAELLKLSLLARQAPPFTLKQDIFRTAEDGAAPVADNPAEPRQVEALQRSIAEEIYQSVSYEGFILKNARRLALLNVSGDFFAVGEGDVIVGKIRILRVGKDTVTIEYDGQPYEIRIKGDQNG